MADWTQSMQQTYEYYTVDPGTWKDVKRIDTVTSCTITRDSTTETLQTASIDMTEEIGETYVRVYLITVQNGVRERHVLGTFLAQSSPSSFDGRVTSVSVDCYSPLTELKENSPALGYYVAKGENTMKQVALIAADNMRAPVVAASSTATVYQDFVANTDDTWLSFLSDLAASAKYTFALDELSRVLFEPVRTITSMTPTWTYTDDNASVLYPDIDTDRDLYGIPNVVEVIYSGSTDKYYARVENNDLNSPVSIVNRGREITKRITDPSFSGEPTQAMVNEYAAQQLEALSTVTSTISYSHGYNGVKVGDCIRMNYERAGITDVKAVVVSQSITCEPGCTVEEKAEFTQALWRYSYGTIV